jgi:histone acetyltransferase (RNA polymerase elongator complex component)
MTGKRFDVVYEEDDDYKNIRYWEIKDKKCGATTSNELKICHLLNNLNDENEQLKKDLKSYQSMVKEYINLHIDKIRRRYVNPTREEVAERTRIIRDLEQLKKELQ